MGLVSDGCQDSGSDRMSYWGPLLEVGSSIMGFPTECLSPMRQDLYGSLGSLCCGFTPVNGISRSIRKVD